MAGAPHVMDLRSEIEAAARRIRPHVRRTPVLPFSAGEIGGDFTGFLKLEYLQHVGSFKPRGAFNRMLSAEIPPAGVIAASGGNHGLAVAYAAGVLGVPAEIFVPEIAAPVKIARLRELSATVHVVGRHYAEAWNACAARQAVSKALLVHAYDQPEVLAGQGTVAAEFEEQFPDIDTVMVAVGGGGLVGGIAGWFGGRARVVAVEPQTSCALHAALAAGAPVDVDVSGIAADSLGARRVGEHMFPVARQHVDRVVLVDDAQIRAAQQALWRDFRIVAEPGGATAFAALRSRLYVARRGERVGVVVCGANCDPATITSTP